MRRARPCAKGGFTLVEMLVAIMIIGILAALIVPAVQQARESARRVLCSNNLHQLGIAVNAYAAGFGIMPPGNHSHGYSLHSCLLPYIEQGALFNSINFLVRPHLLTFQPGPNATVFGVSLSVFLCPSDRQPSGSRACTSYCGNMGYGRCQDMPYGACNNGAISMLSSAPISLQAVSDGLSNTVAVSEWLFNPSPPIRKDDKRSVFQLPVPQGSAAQYEDSVSFCRGLAIAQAAIDEGRGENWFHGTIAKTLYTHALPVGGRTCINGSSTLLGIVTAVSQHPGGANTGFADGHVSFIRDTISTATWRSMGTRAGNDVW